MPTAHTHTTQLFDHDVAVQHVNEKRYKFIESMNEPNILSTPPNVSGFNNSDA